MLKFSLGIYEHESIFNFLWKATPASRASNQLATKAVGKKY